MISGATYRGGVAIAPNGAVYVYGLGSSDTPPAGSVNTKGLRQVPLIGKLVTADGALVVRYR